MDISAGKRALVDHAREKGMEIQQKYGPEITLESLYEILQDETCIRFPTRIAFDSSRIDPGMFAVVDAVSERPLDGYIIYLHDSFQSQPEVIPSLVLYHLVVINYGDFATFADAEIFAAAALGKCKEEYYQNLCELTDVLWGAS